MNNSRIAAVKLLLVVCSLALPTSAATSIFCNPLPIAYRFRLEPPSRREAADPTMLVYNNSYWLFPSKSGGYFHSPDLVTWELIEPSGLPLEDYAPTVMDGKVCRFARLLRHSFISPILLLGREDLLHSS